MKRYALFAGQHHYPCGGWNDFVRFGETVEELTLTREEIVEGWLNWAHVVDLWTGEVVKNQDLKVEY